MKTLLFIILLTGALAVISAPLKIAFIGDSTTAQNIADLTTAKLTPKGKVEVYERAAMDKILSEHKLTEAGMNSDRIALLKRFVHVDLFAVINSGISNGKVAVSSLQVFNARNGLKLCDERLPPQIDKSCSHVLNKINEIINQQNQKRKTLPVAILSVRNAGASPEYNIQMSAIAATVEKLLVTTPNVTVLERSKLSIVNKERALTATRYRLIPSVYLLDFEFNSAASPANIILKLYILNSSGKILHKLEFADCLKYNLKTVNMIVKELSRILKQPIKQLSLQSENEAQRYYQEYQFNRNALRSQIAISKLESAIALAPDNPDYRVELIKFLPESIHMNQDMADVQKFDAYLQAGRRIIEDGDNIRVRFPQYNKYIYHCTILLGYMQNIWINRNQLTAEQNLKAKKTAELFRPVYERESRRFYWNFKLDDGIGSVSELEAYDQYIKRSRQLLFYFDYDQALKEQFKAAAELIRRNAEFNRSKSQIKCGIPQWQTHYNNKFFTAFSRQIQGNEAAELIYEAGKHPSKIIREYGLILDLVRKTAINHYDVDQFSKDVESTLKKVSELYGANAHPTIKSASSSPDFILEAISRNKPEIYKVFKQKKRAILQNSYKIGSWKALLDDMRSAKSADQIAEKIVNHSDIIHKWRRCSRIDVANTPGRIMFHWGWWLSKSLDRNNVKNKELCLKALSIMNKPLSIKILQNPFYASPQKQFISANEYDGDLFILSKDKTDISIFKYKPTLNILDEVTTLNNILTGKLYDRAVFRSMYSFYADADFFVISDSERIIVVHRKQGTVNIIKELPAEKVYSLTMLNNRIYALMGKRVYTSTFVSFLPDGTDQVIHFSINRREKQNSFDRQQKFRVSGIHTDKNKQRLIFACSKRLQGLWQFTPGNNKFKKLHDFKCSNMLWSKKIGSKIYITAGMVSSKYFIYDAGNNKLDFIFYKHKKNSTAQYKWLRHTPRHVQALNIPMSFYATGNELWAGGYGLRYIDLEANNGMAHIYGPDGRRTFIFPHQDGHSIYAIDSKKIFLVNPAEKQQNDQTSI